MDSFIALGSGIRNGTKEPWYISQQYGNDSGLFLLWINHLSRINNRFMLKGQIKAKLGMCLCRNSSLINCTLDSDISGLTCIDKEYCPYSEEPKSINLTLFVRNLYRLEEHQRTFFIRDIGKSFCAPVWSLHVMDYVYCGPIIYMNTSI